MFDIYEGGPERVSGMTSNYLDGGLCTTDMQNAIEMAAEQVQDIVSRDRGINPKMLTEKDVGRWVMYHGNAGEKEKGRIKTWDDEVIFVVYKCGDNWDRFTDYTAAATVPSQLTFIDES